MSLEAKYIKFQDFMNEFRHITEDYDYFFEDHEKSKPKRSDLKYTELEKINMHEFDQMIIMEMAIRNEDVIKITKKLDQINKIMKENPSINKIFEINNINSVPNCPWEMEYEILYGEVLTEISNDKIKEICNLELTEFERKLDLFIVNKEGEEYQNYSNLCCFSNYLQKRLKNEFLIYPEGYCTDELVAIDQLIISREEYKFASIRLENRKKELNESLKVFRKFKSKEMNIISDLFFIYDYYKSYKKNENYIAQNIKFLLTIHYGIEFKHIKDKVFTIEDCLNNEDKYKDFEVKFYMVEKSIRNKRKIMEDFIDKGNYKFLILN